MADEQRRRRRGRRRGRGGGGPPEGSGQDRPESQEDLPAEDGPEVTEESEAPGVLPSRLRFGFGRGGGDEKDEGKGKEKERRESHAAAPPGEVSPLSFWRRGRARAYREEPAPKQTWARTWRRIRGMYFPPWVPVAFIIVVVFAILGALFFARGATGAPRIGEHHWHATYEIIICGQRQPPAPEWGGGVHTHADGIIHIHPFTPQEEGAGARLVRWFEYGGGKLTQSEMRIPGSRTEYKNGDTCDDGSEAFLQVFVNDEKLEDWSRYIPQDGDRVRIVFGPEEEAGEQEFEDRIIVPEEEATRTVEIEITGAEADAAFSPDTIELRPGETVRVVIRNTGPISHGLRVAGPDGIYNTGDDFVSDPDIIPPGEEGFVVVSFDAEGQYEFNDPSAVRAQGLFVVEGEPVTDDTDADEAEPVDITLEVTMGDSFFEPAELTVGAGQTFRIILTNEGELIHNMRIAGPDNEFETADDLLSDPSPIRPGESGEIVGQIDEPGTYDIRSDFQRAEMIGAITVE